MTGSKKEKIKQIRTDQLIHLDCPTKDCTYAWIFPPESRDFVKKNICPICGRLQAFVSKHIRGNIFTYRYITDIQEIEALKSSSDFCICGHIEEEHSTMSVSTTDRTVDSSFCCFGIEVRNVTDDKQLLSKISSKDYKPDPMIKYFTFAEADNQTLEIKLSCPCIGFARKI